MKMQTIPYLAEIKTFKFHLLTISFVFILSYLFYNIADGNTVILLGKEDSLFEWLTALFYFVSSVLLILTFRKNRNVFLLLLGILMFFGAGEEISWGQRIFGFVTPESIKKLNVQSEFNIHNLVFFNGIDMDGAAKHGLKKFLSMDFMFKVFTIVFGIILPFLVFHLKPIAFLTRKLKVPVPPICVGIFFAINWLFLILSLSRVPFEANNEHIWRVFMAGPEIAEFIGSFVMATICFYFYNNRNNKIMGIDFKQLPS